MSGLYFDHNATTPVLPEVLEAMLPYLGARFGNPSSPHGWGLDAREGVDKAREQVARLLNAAPSEIVFTSCATESNNTVIQGLCGTSEGELVTSPTEHPAVLEPARALRSFGLRTVLLPVDEQGRVDPRDAAKSLGRMTKLISLMLANNETGVLQPIAEVVKAVRPSGVPVHTDAAQAVGKVVVDVAELGVDYLTIAGHKLYAPKGVGALYVRTGRVLPPLLYGGGQEGGLRSGTENVALIVGLGAACAAASRDLEDEIARQEGLGEKLEAGLARLGRDHMIFGAGADRLPNTCMVGFAGADASRLVEALALEDVAVSAGAACHPGGGGVRSASHVLAAMHAPEEYSLGAVRITWGRFTTGADVDALLAALGRVLG